MTAVMRDRFGIMVAKPPSLAAVTRVLHASPAPSLLVSAGEIVAANQAAADLTGVTDSEHLVGLSLAVFDLDRAVTEQNRNLFRQVASGTVLTLTAAVPFRRLDGTASSAVLAQTGVALADGLFVLITAAGPASGAATPRSTPPARDLAALVTDHDWRVTHATAAARDLVNGTDASGMALFGLVHPMNIAPLASALAALTYSGSSISLRVKTRRSRGWRPIGVAASALCQHAPPRLIVLLTDTPQWSRAEELARSDDRVQAAVVGLAAARAGAARELSDQELEIIARSLRGQRPAEIAEQMFLHRGTVRNALTRIYRRFGVRSQSALVATILTGQASTGSNEWPEPR